MTPRMTRPLVPTLIALAFTGSTFAGDPPSATPPTTPPATPAPAQAPASPAKQMDPSKVPDMIKGSLPGAAPRAGEPGAPHQVPGATAPGVPTPVPQGKGLLTFEETTHDFGKVFDTTPRKWSVKFKNTGTEKLVISQVRPGCGCTATTLAKTDYEPGEEGTIELTWNPTGTGEVTKPVTITSNDMNEPNKVINIKATMVPLVKLDPMFLQGGTIQAGNERPMRLTVMSRDKSFAIKAVNFDNNQTMPWKEVADESKNIDESYPGRKALEFTIPKDAAVGTFMRSMNIVVTATPEGQTAPIDSPFNVRCFANIVGDLMATPAFLTVAGAKPQTAFESNVTVTARSGKPFTVKSAEVADVTPASVTGFTVKTEQLPDNKGWKLILSGNPGDYVGPFRGTIRLVTDIEREGPTMVPFSGMSMNIPPAQPMPAAPSGTPAPNLSPNATKPGTPAPAPAPAPAPKP